MKTTGMALWATAALVAAGSAAAENPAWTYGQAGYYRADNYDDDTTDGFRLKGSLAFADMFHFQAEYLDGSIGSSSGSDEDFDAYRVVIGANPSVGANTDAVFEAQYFSGTYDDACGSGCDEDFDGFGVGAGVRHMLVDKVELNAMAWWNEGNVDPDGGSDSDFTDISLELGGRYLFTDNFSAGVTITTNDSIVGGDSAVLDVRWQFDDML